MLTIIICISLIYLALIFSFYWGFDRVPEFELTDSKPTTHFSIVIPFRNEALNLTALLTSLRELQYSSSYFEVIFVDDASEDNSVTLIDDFFSKNPNSQIINYRIFENIPVSNSPKKDALALAISHAKNPWIITTDADCIVPVHWLLAFDQFIQTKDVDMVVAPVTYSKSFGFLENFQLMEVLSLQGATIGGFGIKKPFMCNGANLAYTRSTFEKLDGFKGNDTIASGDDIFLMEKALQAPDITVAYLKCKSSIVSTGALKKHSQVIQQRVRWAAKSSASRNLFGKLSGFIVLSQNAAIIIGLLLCLIGFISPRSFLYVIIIKFSIDFLLLFKTARFFNQERHLSYYPLSALYYPIFTLYVGFIAVFKGFQWKGRRYRQ